MDMIPATTLAWWKRQNGRVPTRHHREARSNGGTNDDGNVVKVPKKAHAYYHAFFQAKRPLQIIQYLNRFWLPLRVTAVCIPTNRLTDALRILTEQGILDSDDPFHYGITEEHLRHHGKPCEKLALQPRYPLRSKRPE
jgi:hypothetical protein